MLGTNGCPTLVFPEMKTALRSYHPVPSLQKTDGNLQDAPRIKNCLKAALLPFEFKTPPPSSPAEIIEKTVSTDVFRPFRKHLTIHCSEQASSHLRA